MLDWRIDKYVVGIFLLTIILVVVGNFGVPLYDGKTVFWIEQTHALMLFSMAIVSCAVYSQPKFGAATKDKQLFWLWTACWWLLLFGRSISWGRDYFPEFERFYFKIIAVSLHILVLVVLLFKGVRREIVRRWKFEKIPVWHTLMAFLYFGLVDIVEHNRLGINLLLADFTHQDLVEEMLEYSVILSLMWVVFYLRKYEIPTTSKLL